MAEWPLSARPAAGLSVRRYLGATGVALWALVMALRPDPGFSAPWAWMALFWALQIGVGLAVLQTVLWLMSRQPWLHRGPLWLLVLASGVLGAALLTPVYWLIGEGLMQTVLGFEASLDDDGDTGALLPFGMQALLQEFAEIVGPVTASWVLISWPRLQGLLPPLVISPQATAITPDPSIPFGEPVATATATSTKASASGAANPVSAAAWRAGLPPELGDDLVAVTSELQYLRVWTTRGCALVLGALQDVEEAEGRAGMRVHRSWWVHARHVRSVRSRGDGAVCTLSDGREVPVSRRRKAEVLARFGEAALYQVAATAPPAEHASRDQKERRKPS